MGNKHQPEIVICQDSKYAADCVAKQFALAIKEKPKIVLGLATGGTPVAVYEKLVCWNQNGEVCFNACKTFNLDEYVGLEPEHEQSYRYFMQDNLFNHVNVKKENTYVPSGIAEDLNQACVHYESEIHAAGGIDLQLLGIGENGHIAFNEPGSDPSGRTSVVNLTENTIKANSRFFEAIDDVPTTAVTLGIGTILEADRIILMATGKNKAEAVSRALTGEPALDSPASYLMTRNNVIFVLDSDAAEQLPESLLQSATRVP